MSRMALLGLMLLACAQVDTAGRDDAGAAVDAGVDGSVGPGDGLVPWYVGRPSPLVDVHVSGERHGSPRLSRDGLSLYFTVASEVGSSVFVARRASTLERFGRSVPILGDDLALFHVSSLAVSADELEIVVAAHPLALTTDEDLFTATREDRTERFSALRRIDELSSAELDSEPFLSADGLEIVFASSRSGRPAIYSARRADAGARFSAPVQIDLGISADDHSPSLSADGRRLIFGRLLAVSEVRTFAAARARSDSDTWGEPVEVEEFGAARASTDQVVVSESTGEIFFRSNGPWSPASESIWIAQLCEGERCDEPEVECGEGVRSDDGRHCYWIDRGPLPAGVDWDAAAGLCAKQGAHLASIHSDAEFSLTAELVALDQAMPVAWVGASDRDAECNVAIPDCTFTWETGEPFIYAPWGAGEPNDMSGGEDCVENWGNSGSFNDRSCAYVLNALCEREMWPLW